MNLIRKALIKFGPLLGESGIAPLNSTVNYLEVGRWIRANGFHPVVTVKKRTELFERVASHIKDKKVLYLEFGVAEGDSIRLWSRLLGNPECRLHGFDTFEGLPFDWRAGFQKGAFSTKGILPSCSDSRIDFFKGLFEETLPSYVPGDYEVLFINVDCDLYSSAFFVLKSLNPYIQPGTYIYFDEFCDRNNELRAFHDFLALTGKRFTLEGASETYRFALFKCS